MDAGREDAAPAAGEGAAPRPAAGWSRLRAWLPPLAWAAAIAWESSRSNPLPPALEGILSQDKLLHAAAYAALALLLARALWRTGVGARRWPAIAVALASAYGVTDEVHQLFVPNRSADPRDWVADTLGAAVAAALAALVLRWRGARARVRA